MQVVKAKNGTVTTLLDSGPVDLSKMGKVSVTRSSEILFDEEEQMFYIKFLAPELGFYNTFYRSLFFKTYKQAVAEEIKLINGARINGRM